MSRLDPTHYKTTTETNPRCGDSNGKPCVRSNGPQCVTRLGYGSFNSSVAGYETAYPSANSGVQDNFGAYTDTPYTVPVYQTCTACGTNKIGTC